MDKALSKSLIALLCAVIIVIFIYGYATVKNNPSSNRDVYNSWIKAEATIVGSDVVMNQNWLIIEYISKDSIKYKTKIEAPTNENYTNNTIEIFYNPSNPKDVFRETDKVK